MKVNRPMAKKIIKLYVLMHMHACTERHIPDLLNILNGVSSQWKKVGLFLGIKNNDLDGIKQENSNTFERFHQVLCSCQKEGKLTKRILCETLSKTSIECEGEIIDELKQWKPFGEKAIAIEGPFH